MAGMLATTLANGDYISISLMVTIIVAAVGAQRMISTAATKAADQRRTDRESDTARHHDLDKRISLREQQAELAPVLGKLTAVLERTLERDNPRGSGVYRRPSDGD